MNESLVYILLSIIIVQLVIVQRTSQPRKKTAIGGSVPVIIDTSALMDGRIVTIATLGFMSGPLIIPRSVILELQLLADKADSDKRTRARSGLDAIKQLQQLEDLPVTILDEESADGVDNHLVRLAKTYSGKICTIDFNLNKVAQAEKIIVINPNELAKNIRMAYLPGEVISLELVQKGQDAHQAVGYLADGTMVVVEQAAKKVGGTVEVEFTRALQTAAGRMMFARMVQTSKTAGKTKQAGGQSQSARRQQKQTGRKVTNEDRMVGLANEGK